MNNQRPSKSSSSPGRFFRKFFLSAFVVSSFVLYAVHRSFASSDNPALLATPGTQITSSQTFTPTAPPIPSTGQSGGGATLPPLASPTSPSQLAQAPSASGYKDGTYTGPMVDAFYGIVQVQTVIQNGKIKSVQFLQYPNDRQTSVRINSIAIPYLQQEALQAQSSNVDIITGATLTSEGFMMSLQAALGQAKG